MGGRGSGSNMASSGQSGGSYMSNQRNMEDYAVAVGMFDRDYMKTAEGRQALKDFMDDEREAGLTEQDMRQAIRDTGSNRNRGTGSRNTDTTGGGGTYTVNDVPSRVQSYTTTGTAGVSGDYESRRYVTRKGDAIKEVTKYKDGGKRTETIMQNYPQYPQFNRTRAQFESELAKMARADIRTGGKVTAIDDKKKGR